MHNFWDKQPVPREGSKFGELDTGREIIKNPLKLPDGFVWSECTLEEARLFLQKHYSEEEVTFKFNYTSEILNWCTQTDGYENIAIRTDDGKIIGYISSVPIKLKIQSDIVNAVQINFLCVHSEFRASRFAPILISEIKRRANIRGIWQAIYTATTKIPVPLCKSEYWHRFLNVKNLVKTKFFNTNRLREKYYEAMAPSYTNFLSRDHEENLLFKPTPHPQSCLEYSHPFC